MRAPKHGGKGPGGWSERGTNPQNGNGEQGSERRQRRERGRRAARAAIEPGIAMVAGRMRQQMAHRCAAIRKGGTNARDGGR